MTDKVNYALAPAGATDYAFLYEVMYWLKYDRAWLYFDDSRNSWELCWQDEQIENEKEIPERECELNRLAEESAWQLVSMQCKNETWDLTKEEWQQRRAERIEAGLIEVDNPVTSSLTNSQAKEMELDMLKGENIEPEYTHEYCDYGTRKRCTIFCDDKDANGNIVVKNAFDEFVLTQAGSVWPLKTPEQKAKELRYSVTYDLAQNIIRPFAEDKSNGVEIRGYFPLAEFIYDRLTESGVDLTPLIKEQTK